MTSGGRAVTSGGAWVAAFLRRHRPVLLLLATMASASCVVNAASQAHDLAEAGVATRGWEPWVWEGSSLIAWLLLMPVIGGVALTLRERPWWQQLAGNLLATIPVSAVHVLVMVALRQPPYRLNGLRYGFDWGGANLLYEWRKDVLSYAIVALAFLIHARFQAAPVAAAAPDPAPEPPRLEVRDQGRTWWLAPADIAWAAAAGNYVELHTAHGALLHRVTLAALAETLAPHGFARIHRSRLVRKAAIRAVAPTPSGDFEVELADGTRLAGSRRYRSEL